MPCKDKPLSQNKDNKSIKKTAGKSEPDFIPTKDKNPDDLEIIE